MTDEIRPDSGMNRRDLIKRGAVVGGAVWAVPVVDSLVSPAHAQGSPVTAECGRMTGGGKLTFDDGTQTSNDQGGGFTLHCNLAATPPHPQNLVVTWPDPVSGDEAQFKMQNLSFAECIDYPNIDQGPNAPFDTFNGKGEGTLKIGGGPADPGYCIEFSFTDAGEPGNDDFGSLRIFDCVTNATVKQTSGFVDRGNFQAHEATGTRAC